jgi:flagellar M-ring protein FliF
MDNAAVVNASNNLPANTGTLARMVAMPLRAKVTLALGTAALVAVLVALAMWARQGDWRVLFANLGDKDAGAIVAQLSTLNVPYRHAEGGQAILVPAEHVHDVRLKLAQSGLPKGSVVGFELMDNARFGQTQFQERLTFQRGLEGELVRSIGSLAAVQSARVHLALPQQNGFFREQQKPRASVLVALHPGRSLDRAQVAGIVHLVSSSVPELNPKSVSVLDQSGTLLSSSGDDNAVGGDGQQLQYVQQVEALHLKRLIDILEPVVGRDNLRATVSAEIDFSQTEATSEAYKPNQGKEPAAVRSAQTSEQLGQGTPQPSGVPGAQTNQPPVPPAAPLTGASAPLQGSGPAGASGGNQRRESITNYEVDKTVRVVRAATGTIKRLNAAVVVNHRSSKNDQGETKLEPLGDDELAKLTSLAQEAVGFNKDRGDSVKVVNAPFRGDAAAKLEPVPMWRQPWLLDLLRSLAAPVLLALLGLVIVFTVVRPALKSARPAASPADEKAPAADAAAGAVAAVVDDPLALPGASNTDTPRTPEEKLAQARAMAKRNPEAVAGIVRGWTQGANA